MSDRLEEIVAACLERMETEGPAALEEACADHPDLADEIRHRVGALADAGLIAATPLPLPERLGPYRLGDRIGGGGMGDVFLAEQETLGRQVALKVMRPEFLHSADTRRRFRRRL